MSSLPPSAERAGDRGDRLFVFGLGYSAQCLARRFIGAGQAVAGTTRNPVRTEELRKAGVAVVLLRAGLPLPDAADALAGTTHVLVSIPPDEVGDPVLRAHGRDLLRLPALRWVGYLSTTAVYGDTGGDWIGEADPVRPTQARARRRVAAEGAWLASGLPVHVFRLAGIYGPGRNQLEQLRAGTARRIVKPAQVFGRVHVDDIAGTLLASMARPNPGAIYNIADDEPAPPQDVVTFASELLGIEPPAEEAFDAAALSPMAASFYADNRRVANDRIKQELRVRLAFPTYREGLRALL